MPIYLLEENEEVRDAHQYKRRVLQCKLRLVSVRSGQGLRYPKGLTVTKETCFIGMPIHVDA